MDEQEQKAAKAILERIAKAESSSEEIVQLANAYQALTQGYLNRHAAIR